MNFSIAETISRLCAPRHELSCSWLLWRRLLAGCGSVAITIAVKAVHFCSDTVAAGRIRIVEFVPYDDLDSEVSRYRNCPL